MSGLETEFLFELHADLAPPIDVGATPNGQRLIVLVTGGWFEGPKLKGKVIPNSGGDWAMIRADGSFALDVRASLETDDGAQIYTSYSGRAVAQSPEQLAQILDFTASPGVDPSTYYFRTNPVFETGAEKYAWLNGILAIGKGRLGDGGVHYDVFAIK